MRKTKLFGAIVKQVVSKPFSLYRVVDFDEYYRKFLKKKYGITGLPTISISQLFPGFDVEISNYCYLEGSSLAIDIAFLRKLASGYKDCNYFELGCWRGESLYNLAQVSKSCTALSLSKEEMTEMGVEKEIIEQTHFFSKDLMNVKFINHNSLTYDFNLIKDRFDVLFIDGDHHYESIVSDTKNVLSLRRNDQSVIVWHDYGFNPEMVRPEVLAGILDGLPSHLHKYLFHISNTKCAALIMKDYGKLPVQKYPAIPDKVFRVKITIDDLGK